MPSEKLRTIAREWLDKYTTTPLSLYDQRIASLAALIEQREEQRDEWWRSRGHSDGKGGCFYQTPPQTIPGIQQQARAEVLAEVKALLLAGDYLDESEVADLMRRLGGK